MRIPGRSLLPQVPREGTVVIPLLNADEIFQAELDVVGSTKPGENLYVSHYSLPKLKEPQSLGTPASEAQRQFLGQIESQVRNQNVKAFVVADNSRDESGSQTATLRNEETLEALRASGVFALPYPSEIVSINHTKFIANDRYLVVTSANLSSHSADSPDDNTGFLLSGAAVHNGITHAFLPQWDISGKLDSRGWAKAYPQLSVDPGASFDEKVTWLNTAPKEEAGQAADQTEIYEAYRKMIERAAGGPPNAYLYFECFDLSNLFLLRHLLYARHVNPKLDIRFILDPNQYLEGMKTGGHDARAVAYDEVKNAGLWVRFARVKVPPPGSRDPQRFHDKFGIYNDEMIVNGSGNFSNHSLNGNIGMSFGIVSSKNRLQDIPPPEASESVRSTGRHNREVDVLVRDSESVRAFKEKFLNDWMYGSCDDPRVAGGEGFGAPHAKSMSFPRRAG